MQKGLICDQVPYISGLTTTVAEDVFSKIHPVLKKAYPNDYICRTSSGYCEALSLVRHDGGGEVEQMAVHFRVPDQEKADFIVVLHPKIAELISEYLPHVG